MSLSLQKKHSIDKSFLKEFDPLPCPECGQVEMKRIKSGCTLADGTFIPNLEYFYCSSCNSRFYDDAAMTRIEKQRESLSVEKDVNL
jgi:hypothetical protein